jgi:hypothetical protein
MEILKYYKLIGSPTLKNIVQTVRNEEVMLSDIQSLWSKAQSIQFCRYPNRNAKLLPSVNKLDVTAEQSCLLR